jgi:KDO2-lipid IV(A) lauroyltransferase
MQIYLIKIILFIFKLLPDKLSEALGKGLGLFWFHIVRYRRNLVFDNLKQAFKDEKTDKEIYTIARNNFMHYGVYFTEFLKIPSWSNETIKTKIDVSGMEKFDKVLSHKKGAIVICGHYGNFDLMNVAQAVLGLKSNVITRRAKNQSVDKFWQEIREAKGVKFLPDRNSVFSILKALKKNELVAMIIDQHMGGKLGIRVNFFGRPASTMRAVALIAKKTSCPVIPVFNHKDNGIEKITVGDEIPFINHDDDEEAIRQNTQQYNDIIENFIRQHPEQWLWVHRRWK